MTHQGFAEGAHAGEQGLLVVDSNQRDPQHDAEDHHGGYHGIGHGIKWIRRQVQCQRVERLGSLQQAGAEQRGRCPVGVGQCQEQVGNLGNPPDQQNQQATSDAYAFCDVCIKPAQPAYQRDQ